ncbi:hypothetical protein [Tetragenococcus muriaticus]|uniref:hypothetical protein n=1 Tax=Tetragenococcus muriaticus TaxID=64642 RepID=UPI0003FF4A00|nr:hypothetical protein [Tetragenococcus muriaticus]GMA46933.1 hypothetical protein GCM10025854_11830 [Tetragenococcus muriaticus]
MVNYEDDINEEEEEDQENNEKTYKFTITTQYLKYNKKLDTIKRAEHIVKLNKKK